MSQFYLMSKREVSFNNEDRYIVTVFSTKRYRLKGVTQNPQYLKTAVIKNRST